MVAIRSHLHNVASDSVWGTGNVLNKYFFEFVIYFHVLQHLFFSSFLFPNSPTQTKIQFYSSDKP